MKNIGEILKENHVPLYPDNEVLSSSERAHATIVQALLTHWDSLDGAQQMRLAGALKTSAQRTRDEESAGLEFLGINPRNRF